MIYIISFIISLDYIYVNNKNKQYMITVYCNDDDSRNGNRMLYL